jgi:NADPH:quinone reductase-like Zn-dependent oxidoreductase
MFFIAKSGSDDLVILSDLIEAGEVTPAIERRFELGQIADAMRAMDGHASAKIVITV